MIFTTCALVNPVYKTRAHTYTHIYIWKESQTQIHINGQSGQCPSLFIRPSVKFCLGHPWTINGQGTDWFVCSSLPLPCKDIRNVRTDTRIIVGIIITVKIKLALHLTYGDREHEFCCICMQSELSTQYAWWELNELEIIIF